MNINFTKMHGLGNDFMVVDAIRQPLPEDQPFTRQQLRRLADRHYGVGFDQLLVVQKARAAGVDFRYRIFNADGSEVNQCGNGARCFARFVRDQGLTDKHDIHVETAAGQMILHITDAGQVTVNMGLPHWAPEQVPLRAKAESDTYVLVRDGQAWEVSAVSLGNPHCVLLVENVDTAPVATVGPLLEDHPDFPERVNVGFMQIIGRDHIRLRVYERGSGETLACGSGACAAVVCGQRRGLLNEDVRVDLRGGTLTVEHVACHPVLMTGPAARVYDGQIMIEG